MLIEIDSGKDSVDPCTGILLIPSLHGEHCLGNGLHPGYECCCDECDYLLECFPDWEQLSEDRNLPNNK